MKDLLDKKKKILDIVGKKVTSQKFLDELAEKTSVESGLMIFQLFLKSRAFMMKLGVWTEFLSSLSLKQKVEVSYIENSLEK